MFCKKPFYNIAVLQLYSKSLKRTYMKGINFGIVAGLQPVTLLKNELLLDCFSRFLNAVTESLIWRTALGGFFYIKAQRSYLTEHFSVDAFKVKNNCLIYQHQSWHQIFHSKALFFQVITPTRSKFVKQAAKIYILILLPDLIIIALLLSRFFFLR